MSLIKWNPNSFLDNFFDDNFFNSSFLKNYKNNDLAVDVYKKDGKIMVEMQSAGIKPEDIDIYIEDGFLKISGKREEEKEEKDKNYYSKQIFRGSFERTIPLTEEIDDKKIKAETDNGMLKIELPIKDYKKKIEKKKIKVKKAKK